MEKRGFIALGLSLLFLALYPLALEHFYPDYYKQKAALSSAGQKAARPAPAPTAGAPAVVSPEEVSAADPARDTALKTGSLELWFNAEGGAIRQIRLPRFPGEKAGSPLEIFALDRMDDAPTALQTGPAGGRAMTTYHITSWGEEVAASAALPDGLEVVKKYSFENGGYDGRLGLVFKNASGRPLKFRYRLLVGPSIPPRHAIDGQYIEANFYSEENGKKVLRHLNESKSGKTVEGQGTIEWAATKDRHFSVILKPQSDVAFKGLVEGLGSHRFRVSLESPELLVPPGGSLAHDFLLYIGPNDIDRLLPLGLDPLVNFGKLDAIGKLLVGALELLQKACGNYGLAIIALTFLINVLLFPLTRVSYMSMKRMQLIQPHMNKIKDQHKKNPEKLNKEMMELYRKHKVNPFGGCLPMVLQMPVFMALYVALSKSVALVDSRFLWARDLSSPDAVPLPFALPFVGSQLHVLPLIMVAAMVIQQKFTQIKIEGQDPAMESQQKMMAVVMPIMFGFIFYGMPSGLVLYWLTNTVLMALYQAHLKKLTLA
ncbi:MAG: membrane protein insertase YidC [Candidatus Omnitrophica bacterium]|nr:membrane protein insertase YidC [Candidatus Omnitrophota bacterium]